MTTLSFFSPTSPFLVFISLWSVAGFVVFLFTQAEFLEFKMALWKYVIWMVVVGPLIWALGAGAYWLDARKNNRDEHD